MEVISFNAVGSWLDANSFCQQNFENKLKTALKFVRAQYKF